MRVYIGEYLYEIDEKAVAAAKTIVYKNLQTIRELCESSGGGKYLYIATLVMQKTIAERTLKSLSEDALVQLFPKCPKNKCD